jgi:hypothetical protein
MDISALDKVLEELNDRYPSALFVDEFVVHNLHIDDPKKYIKYSSFILDKGLGKLTEHPDSSRLIISSLGQLVVKLGGYEKYLAESERQQKEKADNDLIAARKLRDDAKLSEWKRKTFWYVFGFGIWGGLTGTIALGLELQDRYSKWQERQSEQFQIEQDVASANSSDMTKEAVQYSNSDTLK